MKIYTIYLIFLTLYTFTNASYYNCIYFLEVLDNNIQVNVERLDLTGQTSHGKLSQVNLCNKNEQEDCQKIAEEQVKKSTNNVDLNMKNSFGKTLGESLCSILYDATYAKITVGSWFDCTFDGKRLNETTHGKGVISKDKLTCRRGRRIRITNWILKFIQ